MSSRKKTPFSWPIPVVGGGATTGCAMIGAPTVVVVVVLLATVILCLAQILMPQESAHRLQWWQTVLDHLERARGRRVGNSHKNRP